jgi:hypothetical protein
VCLFGCGEETLSPSLFCSHACSSLLFLTQGAIVYTTVGGSVRRISYTQQEENHPPFFKSVVVDRRSRSQPVQVSLTANAVDPDDDKLTYDW